MSENNPQEESLADEFRNLGKNLADSARAAWDTPERVKLQSEIESGLSELSTTLNREYEHFRESPTAAQIKEDVDDFSERVRSSEIESKIRSEFVSALHQVNSELEKLTSRWTSTPSEASETEPGAEDTGAEASRTEPDAEDTQAEG